MKLDLSLRLGRSIIKTPGGPIAPPAWFDWTPTFSVSKKNGVYRASVAAADFRPAAGTTLYVSPTGSNANNGTTPALAKRSIANAYNAGAGTIIAAPGNYTRTDGMEGITYAARDLTIINSDPNSGPVVIARYEPSTALTWVQNGTYPNVWSCTRSTAVAVRDRSVVDANGVHQRLIPRADVATVAANPGSQFITGSTVNVSLSDGRQPDANVMVFLSGPNAVVNATMAGKTLWVGQGVEFWGGNSALGTTGLAVGDGTKIVADRAAFKYATDASAGNGLSISLVSASYLFGVRCDGNILDGFNYHAVGGGKPFALEVDCLARGNGVIGGGNSNNGTTAHEDYRVIRLNGEYGSNEGPQVVDIDTAQSWNLGVKAKGPATNFRTQGTAKMTLDSCDSQGATTDLSVGGGTLYYRNLTGGQVFAGSPTPY